MSHSKNSNAVRVEQKEQIQRIGEIIPWPNLTPSVQDKNHQKEGRVKLGRKYLYYKDKKIPILHFQKAGYGKLLKLLVKEIQG